MVIITINLTAVKVVLRLGWDFDNMFGLGCLPYTIMLLFFNTFYRLEILKISVPEFLKRLHLFFARKAGPDRMLILNTCVHKIFITVVLV